MRRRWWCPYRGSNNVCSLCLRFQQVLLIVLEFFISLSRHEKSRGRFLEFRLHGKSLKVFKLGFVKILNILLLSFRSYLLIFLLLVDFCLQWSLSTFFKLITNCLKVLCKPEKRLNKLFKTLQKSYRIWRDNWQMRKGFYGVDSPHDRHRAVGMRVCCY